MAEQGRRRRKWPFRVLIGVIIVAVLLMIAQDQETLYVESPIDAT